MNILDITPADIERWKKGLRTPELTDRDSEVRKLIGEDHFGFRTESYLKQSYTLPAPTEADIIAYLQASEVPPAQWHPAAQEWAKRHDGEPIWEHQHAYGKSWGKTSFITTGGDELYSVIPFRLRADYGRKDAGYVEFTDPPKSINPSDVSYGPFTLEPEVCVWGVTCVATVFRDPHKGIFYFHINDIKEAPFCPVCGKRIEIKQ